MKWIYLVIAIIGELIATSALKESKGFSILKPSIVSVIGYGITFYFLSLAIKQIPLGIAYAIWAGLGIILITAIGYFRFKQTLDLPAIIGLSLILIGVVIVNGFSKTI
ncbi:DMT family transporter [Flagellimonas meridianipacifica]|uniref:Small multidrug resistance pump n=1 Tax=Flagellimonas meridianipacifica TaxID=1080225 RepID=A0A2T0MAR9_9FLAO|nr:multidrug efflux SMR transporter [Allomuricauda pacifica]PRX54601.1 small multidrug resistance pump [Allomuricauda pacifica]